MQWFQKRRVTSIVCLVFIFGLGVYALAGKGGRITVSGARNERGSVTVRVADTGAGVPYEVRDRIFEPGVTTKEGGWGVGLTLSRRIIEVVHGGRIELSDGRDEGATFYIRLPAAVSV